MWPNRANLRANLPRAGAAVLSVVAVYVLLDKWNGAPFRLDAPIIVSIVVALNVLARSHSSVPHS